MNNNDIIEKCAKICFDADKSTHPSDLGAMLMELKEEPDYKKSVSEYKIGDWFEARSIEEMTEFYMSRLPAIRKAARDCGYAIGLHGSTKRDFDLMAMPWVEDCKDPNELAHAIAIAACGITHNRDYHWENKPLGRIATTICICWTDHSDNFDKNLFGFGHLDLSIIGRLPASSSDKPTADLASTKDDALPERDPNKPAEEQGCFNKFTVKRNDGLDLPGQKHNNCSYFVLDLDHDPHAMPALLTYAVECKKTHPVLSQDLFEKYNLISQLEARIKSVMEHLADFENDLTVLFADDAYVKNGKAYLLEQFLTAFSIGAGMSFDSKHPSMKNKRLEELKIWNISKHSDNHFSAYSSDAYIKIESFNENVESSLSILRVLINAASSGIKKIDKPSRECKAWFIDEINMVTTSVEEKDKWLSSGRKVTCLYADRSV